MPKRPLNPRKLLVASAGVATINYLGVNACSSSSVANLMAPAISDGGRDATPDVLIANLVAPPPHHMDATVANLVAPAPSSRKQ